MPEAVVTAVPDRERAPVPVLFDRLESLVRTYDRRHLDSDPLRFLHRYRDPRDIEIVGLVASSLAYGAVAQIGASVTRVLDAMGSSPAAFVHAFTPARDARRFRGFVHRFNRSRDFVALLWMARGALRDAGSIGAYFERGLAPGAPTIREALVSFVERLLATDMTAVYGRPRLPAGAGVRFFLPSPADGSAVKRLNLYLRWMVRGGDGLDFGLWKGVGPERLVMPVDAHVARISRYIGLTRRASADWRTAEEITACLRTLDPADPVKYDFALSRLGILDHCPRKRDLRKCAACPIQEVCLL
jgi:uncharacterized protein (TIGR02757 family)